jgi:nucleotide-binding universal stress UspA family protein
MTVRTLVVPLDGSRFAERAVPVASAIARRVGSELLFVSAPWDTLLMDANTYLDGIASGIEDVPTSTRVVDHAPPARVIGDVCAEEPDRVVCMTSHGRGKLRWAFLGSVAEAVVRESLEPVILVGRHCDEAWPAPDARLLVAVECSTVDDPVVPVAIEWAKTLGMGVQVTHVVHPLDVAAGETPNPEPAAIAQSIATAGIDATSEEPPGWYIAGTLADAARETPASLIAMRTHAPTGMARVSLGSVTMATVNVAPCPVLVVPPTG